MSFSDSSSAPSQIGERCSHRNRYVQQINRTPNRCKIAPSPEHSVINAFQFQSSSTSPSNNSLIFSDFHHTNNNHQRTNQNLRKCFQASRGAKDPTYLNEEIRANALHRGRSTAATTSFSEEEIIFTENKIYVGMAEAKSRKHSRPCSARENNAANEVIFEKVQLNRRTNHTNSSPSGRVGCSNHNMGHDCYPFETSADVSFNGSLQSSPSYDFEDGSPTKRLSEYDNLNETFWHSHIHDSGIGRSSTKGDCMTNDGHCKSAYADTWDFLTASKCTPPPIPPTANANMVQNKYEIHYESAVSASSRRTSISTLETWIDDEVFDNSFNEELEKRCAKLCLAYH